MWIFLFTQEHLGAFVDFVSTYRKIGVTKILMNVKIHVNFHLPTVHTQNLSAHVS